jgi:hypothetical protein
MAGGAGAQAHVSLTSFGESPTQAFRRGRSRVRVRDHKPRENLA